MSSTPRRSLPNSAPHPRRVSTRHAPSDTRSTLDINDMNVSDIRAMACALEVVSPADIPMKGKGNTKWASKANLREHIIIMSNNTSVVPMDYARDMIAMGEEIISKAIQQAQDGEGEPQGEWNGGEEEKKDGEGEPHLERLLRLARERALPPSPFSQPRTTLTPASLTDSLNQIGSSVPSPSRISHSLTTSHGSPLGTFISHPSSTVHGAGEEGRVDMHMHAELQERLLRMERMISASHGHTYAPTHAPVATPAPTHPPALTPAQIAYMQSYGWSPPPPSLSPSLSAHLIQPAHVPSSGSGLSSLLGLAPSSIVPALSSSAAAGSAAIPFLDVHALMGDQLKPFDPAVQVLLANGTCGELDKYLRPRIIKEEHDVLQFIAAPDKSITQRRVSDKRVVLTIDDLIEAIGEECSLLTEQALVLDRVQFLTLITRLAKQYTEFAAIRYARIAIDRCLTPLRDVKDPTIAQRCISVLNDAAYRGLTAPRAPSGPSLSSHTDEREMKRKSTNSTATLPSSSRDRSKRARVNGPPSTTTRLMGPVPDSCHNWNTRGQCSRDPCRFAHACMWCGGSHSAATSDACRQKGGRPTPSGPGGPEQGT